MRSSDSDLKGKLLGSSLPIGSVLVIPVTLTSGSTPGQGVFSLAPAEHMVGAAYTYVNRVGGLLGPERAAYSFSQ